MPSLLHELRLAFRQVIRRPGFSLAVIAVLGVCLGAEGALFSLVDATLLRPLPFRDADHLVYLSEQLPAVMSGNIPFAVPDLMAMRQQTRAFSEMGWYRNRSVELSGQGAPATLTATRISASLFPALGIAPALGRSFTEQEDTQGARTVILGDRLWRSRFGGDQQILGRKVELDRVPYTVIGVLPPGRAFPPVGPRFNPDQGDLYIPISFNRQELSELGTRFNHSVIARLRPGVNLQQTNAELQAAARRIGAVYLGSTNLSRFSMTAVPLREEVVGQTRPVLLFLFAGVSLLLLIGCVDIAGLLLTRAAGREREMSIRTALGAPASALVRQQMAESLVLALLGGGVGLVLVVLAGGVVSRFVGAPVEGTASGVALNGHVLLFTFALAVLCTVVFGLLPALRGAWAASAAVLREGGRSQTSSLRQRRLLDSIVVLQFALAMVLLMAAGLLLKSFVQMMNADPGFAASRVLTASFRLPAESYGGAGDLRRFAGQLQRDLGALPGLQGIAFATSLPLSINEHRSFSIEGRPQTNQAPTHESDHIWVGGDFFSVLQIPLVAGRYLTGDDTERTAPVVVINRTLAQRFFGKEDPIGHRIKSGSDNGTEPWMTIVGVVGDVKASAMNEAPKAETFSPWRQVADKDLPDWITNEYRNLTLLARSDRDPMLLRSQLEQTLRRVDPNLALDRVGTMQSRVNDSMEARRLQTMLVGGFAGAALLLAALGTGGVLAYSVAQRAPEFGVRLAIGAKPSGIARLVLLQGLKLTAAGAVLGLLGGSAMTRAIAGLLYRTAPDDAVTLGATVALMFCIALLAMLLPVRRAATVDPMCVLRAE